MKKLALFSVCLQAYGSTFGKSVLVMLILLLQQFNLFSQTLAFPGAEGFGRFAIGGRGGTVIEVTNLQDTGIGSFRAACEASGPRIVVFRVGGLISLYSRIYIANPYITIAGQTAPGDGICIRGGQLSINTHDVIVRYIRSRAGDNSDYNSGIYPDNRDCFEIQNDVTPPYNIILDHCSATWGVDEVMSTWYPCHDITIQWSIIGEGLDSSLHSYGPHSKGLLIGDGARNISVHHNLFAYNSFRNPEIKGSTTTEVINNVMAGWGTENSSNVYIGLLQNEGHTVLEPTYSDMIGNYMKAGATSWNTYGIRANGNMDVNSKLYIKDNIGPGRQTGSEPELDILRGSDAGFATTTRQIPSSTITTQTSFDGYDQVMANVGAILPKRDAVDVRIVNNVENGTGTIINSQSQVGGYPTYNSVTAPTDTDHDGMPDVWEAQYGLNINSAADGNYDSDNDGYTNMEEFLNGTNPGTIGSTDTTPPSIPAGLYSSKIGSNSFTLSWVASTDNNTGVKSYEVFRGATSVGTTSGNTMNVTGLTAGTSYAMTVKARDVANNVSAANSPAFNVTTSTPGANLLVNPGFESGITAWTVWETPTIATTNFRTGTKCLKLSALPFDGDAQVVTTGFAAGYIMTIKGWFKYSGTAIKNGDMGYLCHNSAGTQIANISVPVDKSIGTTYTQVTQTFTVPAGTTKITVYVENFDSTNILYVDDMELYVESSADGIAPTKPANLVASSVGAGSFTLSWTASTDNVAVTSYQVFKGTTLVGTTSGTSLNVTGLTPNTVYSIKVKARDAANNISLSSIALNVTTVPDTQAPSVPGGFVTSALTTTSFTLSWTACTDNVSVVSYEVFKGGVSVGTTSNTSLSITGLTASTVYAMTVKAKDAANNVSATNSPAYTVTTADPPNLILNPGFESGTSNWTLWETPPINTTASNVKAGAKSLRLTSAAYHGAAQEITSGFSVGDTITLSGWFKYSGSTTLTGYFGYLCYNSAGTQIANVGVTIAASIGTTYTKITQVFTVPANTVKITVYVENYATSTRNLFADVLSMTVKPGPLMRPARVIANSNNTSKFNALVYPNPVTNRLNLLLTGNKVDDKILVSMFDINGRKVHQSNIGYISNYQIKTEGMPAGIYMLRVTNGNKTITKEVIVK